MRTEDGYIIQQCLDGDSAAFGLLVEKYKKGIYALAYSRIDNFHDAQDITQEVFIKAYQKLRTLRRWDNFMGWLYRITANQCKDWVRSSSRRPDGEFAEDQEPYIVDRPSVDSYRENMVYESVREALDSLPEIYRDVMTLRYFGGMTVKEMSRFLGVSPNTIDRRLKGARIRLKEEMIAMMSTTYQQHELPASFTFRIVEMVKRIRIHTIPRATGLPWGLSLVTGIAIVVMTLGSQMAIYQSPELAVFPSRTEMLKVREISVDILSAPGTSIMAGKQGDTDGGGIYPQNASFLAPAKGGGTWTQKADMPTARWICGSAEVDGKIYVIGGAPTQSTATKVTEEYDPAMDTWTKRASMPTARHGIGAATVDGIIYAIGGNGGSANNVDMATVEAYDPKADKWVKKANMPTARAVLSAVTVDGKIYAIGGAFRAATLRTVEVYDPATDKWTKKADMPTARWRPAACVVDGKIYVFGGARQRTDPYAPTSIVEVYDLATDTWTRASDMPRARFVHSASVVAGEIYIIGGADTAVGEFSTVDVYDPTADTWTTAADLPTPRAGHVANVVDGKIYTIGGMNGPIDAGHPLHSTVEEYAPDLPDTNSSISPERKIPTMWGQVRSAE